MDMNISAVMTSARKAFDAWGIGEKTGDYAAFKAMLADDFTLFSHPTFARGVYSSTQAREKMMALIASRESSPNELTFSNAVFLQADDSVAIQFDSEGMIMGKFPYKGYNTIVLSIRDGRITGFREYFGDIDPQWFR